MCRNPIRNGSFSVGREKNFFFKSPACFIEQRTKRSPDESEVSVTEASMGISVFSNIRGQCLSEHWSSLSRSWKASFVPTQCSPLLCPPFLKCCLPRASAPCGWMLGGYSERNKPVSVFRDSLGSEDSLSHRFGCLFFLHLQHQNNPRWIKNKIK